MATAGGWIMRYDRQPISFAAINQTLLANYRSILPTWLPDGKFEGNEYVALNPTRTDRELGSFKINWRNGKWSDFSCLKKGNNPISLYAYVNKISYSQAAFQLANESNKVLPFVTRVAKAPKTPKDNEYKNQNFALRLWNNSFAAKGTFAEKYLQSRGITMPIPTDIRFLAGHNHRPSGRVFPVMLAAIRNTPEGKIVGVHRTWIMPDGSGKAPISPSKMMLGMAHGGAVRLAEAGKTLVVCEGIETGLSILQSTGLPTWAALSTSGMVSLALPPLSMTKKIIIAGDNDFAGMEAAMNAAENWTKQGYEVRTAFPQIHNDFNDLLMENL